MLRASLHTRGERREVAIVRAQGTVRHGSYRKTRLSRGTCKQHQRTRGACECYSPGPYNPREARGALDRVLGHDARVALCVDRADPAVAPLLVQRDVLPDEHANADAAEVEAVEKGVDLGQLSERERLLLHAALELDDRAAHRSAAPFRLGKRCAGCSVARACETHLIDGCKQ